MADDKRPNKRTEFGKKIATARAFLRQAEALNRHEARIAAHTAIQTWTNIIAVVMSVVTAVALGWIAWNQFKTSEREVALELARSQPQYEVSLSSISSRRADGSPIILDAGPTTEDELPAQLYVAVGRGDGQIRQIRVKQRLEIFLPGSGEPCEVTVNGWWAQRYPTLFQSPAAIFALNNKLKGKGEGATLYPVGTDVYVEYYDVFGAERSDKIHVSPSGVAVVYRGQSFVENDEMDVELRSEPDGFTLYRYRHNDSCARFVYSLDRETITERQKFSVDSSWLTPVPSR